MRFHYVRVFLCIAALLAGCASPQTRISIEEIARDSVPASREKTIALIGATGMAGRYILQRALAEGYPVKVLARTPAKLEGLDQRIEIIQGDVKDPQAISRLLRGSDIIVTALGPVKSDGDAAQMISTTATSIIIAELEATHSRPYIIVSGGAVKVAGDQRNFTGWWMRQLVRLSLGDVLADKQAEYEVLAASDIDWTLVRCPLIDSLPYEKPANASLLTPSSFHLRAGELADFIMREVESPSYTQKAPFLYSD